MTYNGVLKTESEEEEYCGICRFHAESGEYRRQAPKGGSKGSSNTWNLKYDRWATTQDFEWCGEFEKEVL